jgi:hypothetical protein
VEHFRGGRLKGWDPAGKTAVAKARCYDDLNQDLERETEMKKES